MGKIRFKLEDGGFLEGEFTEDAKYLKLKLETLDGELKQFKLHKLQVRALVKGIEKNMESVQPLTKAY